MKDIVNSNNDKINIPDIFRRYNGSLKKGNYEFYCQEFAYSAIYGNLNLHNINKIMELLKLDFMPTILFLVRVDDFNDIYNNFPKFETYPTKVSITNKLEEFLEGKTIKGVVASFLGRDTIGVFLCLKVEEIQNNSKRLYLENLALEMIDYIGEKANHSVSIGISDFSNDINNFPLLYSQCKRAFENNFNMGGGTFAFYDEKEEVSNSIKDKELDNFKMKIIYHIDNLEIEGCNFSIGEFIKFLSNANASSVDIRMHIVKMINYISNYYQEEGVLKETMDIITLNAMKDVLNSSFLDTIEKTLRYFCRIIYEEMKAFNSDIDEKMKLFIDECIKKNYCNSEFNLSYMAQLCNYTPYYFGRIFKEIFGKTFNQYLTYYRIDKSKEYIYGGKFTIEEIAYQVGFNSASYFCTTFKNITGFTPSNYKEEIND